MSEIVRKLEGLGRIVIPKPIRQHLHLTENDSIEFIISGEDEVILKRYVKSCMLCGKKSDLIEISEKYICKECGEKIKTVL